MDILTKVKHDHKSIDALIQELIDSVKEGKNDMQIKDLNIDDSRFTDTHINNNHIFLEDLFEEIKEQIQAEKVALWR